jgi:NitT/TauT family transport system substrate-binding protein
MKKVIVIVLGAVFVFCSVCGLFAGGAKEKSGEYVFKVGTAVTTTLCAAPFYIAIEKNYFEAEGLKWERVNVGDGEAMNLLTNGQIDGINNLVATLIQPLANGLPAKVPLAFHTGCVKVLVPKDSPIKTPADLKGKKIGAASPASSPTIIAKRYLANIGYQVDGDRPDVEFIYQSAAELPLLLKNGAVDAIGLNDPNAQIQENENGLRAIINTATDSYLRDEFCCVVALRADVVKNHPAESAKFIRAIQKASEYVQANPDETARLLGEKKWLPGDPAVNAQILKTYDYRASVSQALVALERNARDLQKIGLLAKDVDVEALVKNTFVALPGVPDTAGPATVSWVDDHIHE